RKTSGWADIGPPTRRMRPAFPQGWLVLVCAEVEAGAPGPQGPQEVVQDDAQAEAPIDRGAARLQLKVVARHALELRVAGEVPDQGEPRRALGGHRPAVGEVVGDRPA